MNDQELTPLSDDLMTELMSGDYLSGDHMNKFNDILSFSTNYRPQNVFFIGALEFVKPAVEPHIQILCSNVKHADQITHWICTFYDGTSVHVYDSLNIQRLSEEQHQYLARLYSGTVPIVYERVQQQPNMIDCGVFAIAFATSLANNKDPTRESYHHSQMRNHLRKIYQTYQLHPFPSCYFLPESERGMKKRGRPKKTTEQAKEKSTKRLSKDLLRKEADRLRKKRERDAETSTKKKSRLLRDREQQAIRNMSETTLERELRLSHLSELARKKRAAESTLERELRLSQLSELATKKRAAESTLERELRLSQLSEHAKQKRAAESTLERKTRLSQLSKHAKMKRSAESTLERKTRLSQLSKHAKMKRATETTLEKNRRSVERNQHRINLERKKQLLTRGNAKQCSQSKQPIQEHYIGEMNVKCNFCGSKNFLAERPQDNKFTTCCQKGRVNLKKLSPYHFPQFLKNLMTGNDPDSQNFMKNIRSYNSAFSFATMGAQIEVPKGFGPFCFRIHGQIYHNAVTLHPADGEQRKYAQLYILDPEEATHQRMSNMANAGCLKRIMEMIGKFISENNDLAKAHKMLHEVENEALAEAKAKGIPPVNVAMAIRHDQSSDLRRYNAPRVNEVAVVFQNTDGEPPFERDLIIHLRPDSRNHCSNKIQRISVLHQSLEPMTYPLLFPYGESGWHSNIPLFDPSKVEKGDETCEKNWGGSRKRVTQMAYYGYRLAVRDEFNQFLSAGKLTQQYMVDSYVKMESNRLKWIRDHQRELHAESYQGLMDYLHTRAAEKGMVAGKPIVLPSSFIGSPRNMQQHYQDAMSIVRKFGKPDLFITMTCNPKWREITDNLKKYERVEHRPDLVSRVFDLKFKELLNEMCKKHVLGKVIAKVHVIEFQKRGLPHAHMLVIFADEDKLCDPEAIDKIVSAEIPDQRHSPRLFEIVLKHMIHGPCGALNLTSPCMEDGKCTKDYPKSFQSETINNLDGYPRYRRCDNGKQAIVRGTDIDNRWVVPYNPYLCLKFNCHINVEVCATVKSVKYLFKYVYKGHDCANIEITNTAGDGILNHDEIKQFMDARYVSAPEAAWRLFGKPMHDQSHTIIRLAVHLPNHQMVYFDPKAETNTVLAASADTDTTLTAWFKLNSKNDEARMFFYHEIPEHFVFQKNKEWSKRKRGGEQVIGRMYTVSIGEGERYFLRLLLLHVRGATSFQDLRTVDNIVYDSFKEAAIKHGLLEDDQVWEDTLKEAISVGMPSPLRQLFAFICVFGTPKEPQKLWKTFLDAFTEDFAIKHNGHTVGCCECENLALQDVNNTLILHGRKCEEFGLNKPPLNLRQNVQDMFNAKVEEDVGKRMYITLNPEQKLAFDIVMHEIYSNNDISNCFFLDGPGGSGKTHLYKTFLSVIRGKGDIVLPAASTGIAANLLKGGRTYHSLYKLPVPLVETSTSNMRVTSSDAVIIRKAKLLIWDEATMAPSHALDAVHRLLQNIMNNNFPFGGKVLLLGGDFRQCLPVIPHARRVAIVQASIRYSELWKEFKILKLKSNVRSVDSDYSEWLLKLGNGELKNSHNLSEDIIEIPEKIVTHGSIVQETYGDRMCPTNVAKFSNTAILCARNDEVAKINEDVLSILEGENHCYHSIDSVDCANEDDKENYPVEFLNSLTPSGMPPNKLNLKVGCIIMLLRNLNTQQGLCNGTRLAVTKLDKNLIHAKILTGSSEGNICFIPRIDLAPSNPDIPFILRRRQFPVKLAFSITINKSQGQTLEKVGIYLNKTVFSHGQLYVAFSRVRRSADIKIKIEEGSNQGKLIPKNSTTFTKNIVFKEVL